MNYIRKKTSKNNWKFLSKTVLFIVFMLVANIAAAQKINDSEIEQAIAIELDFSAAVPSHLIDIEANDGIITLTGITNNLLAKKQARDVALAVKGVRGVVNNIEVLTYNKSDETIKQDVELALLDDPATDSYEINTKVKDAVVELYGQVESWREKELANVVASGVKGVKKVENYISLKFKDKRPDHEIKEDVKQALKWDVRIDDGLINVDVKNGNVKLSGIVGSAKEKDHAEFIAWVLGAKSVNSSNLTVERWARDADLRKNRIDYATDEKIMNAINDALEENPRVKEFRPLITVSNGHVTLDGTVDNLKAKRAAEKTAKNIYGVKDVSNYLKVRPIDIPDDKTLEAKTRNALLRNPYVNRYDIDVSAYNGKVFLNGMVDTYFEKYEAEDVVSGINGVVEIKNNLRTETKENAPYYGYKYDWVVIPPLNIVPYKTDLELKDDIETQLWWSPFVDSDEVNVEVDDGHVELTGTVDTWNEKYYAGINSYEGGAITVDNNLDIKE